MSMEWEIIRGLLDPELGLVLAACWVVGTILKMTPQVPNWSIIYVVMAVAVGCTVWLMGWGPVPLLQGILCGAVAVYGYEAIKAGKEGLVGK